MLSQEDCSDDLIREAVITLGSFAHGELSCAMCLTSTWLSVGSKDSATVVHTGTCVIYMGSGTELLKGSLNLSLRIIPSILHSSATETQWLSGKSV